ncbi:hypothetical protein OG729_36980 [Streptomyces sp. NBC_00210]|uniref:hypothetical protein n=1 Tax=Streptomyces sp. NBC_00210 TaxID=2903636 RepID=UPI0032477DE0
MSVPLSEFLPRFKKYLGVYVMRQTYAETCAFLTGYELGSEHFILKEFHSWLVLRGKGRPELYWPLLVLCEVYEDGALPDIRYFTSEEDGRAVAILFALLEEFFESRAIGGA